MYQFIFQVQVISAHKAYCEAYQAFQLKAVEVHNTQFNAQLLVPNPQLVAILFIVVNGLVVDKKVLSVEPSSNAKLLAEFIYKGFQSHEAE
jgi:hypothetical protein